MFSCFSSSSAQRAKRSRVYVQRTTLPYSVDPESAGFGVPKLRFLQGPPRKKKKLKRILICYGDTLSAAAAFALVRSAWFEESVPLTDCSCHSRASSVVLVRWGRPALRFLIGRFIARTRRGSCCLRLLACVEVCSEARRADAPTTRALARGDARARGRRGFHGVCRRCRRVALRS